MTVKYCQSALMVLFGLLFVCISSGTEIVNTQKPKLVSINSGDLSTEILNADFPKRSDDFQDFNSIGSESIYLKLWNNYVYRWKISLFSFGSRYDLFLRGNSIFTDNVNINVDNSNVDKSSVNKHLPIFFEAVVNQSRYSSGHGKIHNKEFDLLFTFRNKTFSLQCKLENGEDVFKTHMTAPFYLQKCRIYKVKNLHANISSHLLDYDKHSQKVKHRYAKPFTPKAEFVKKGGHFHRQKRSAGSTAQENCVISLVAEHVYFEVIGERSVAHTISEMSISLAEADYIFRQTDFNGDGVGDNIGFQVGNITIYSSDHNYLMRNLYLDGSQTLYEFTGYDFSDYCLGILYLYRDFSPTVGMAYLGGSNPSQIAGICPQSDHSRSYNVGFVTQRSGGRDISSLYTGIILAHEFGHSFGSDHDDTSNNQCVPGTGHSEGNYIMYPYTSSGEKANNRLFSSCSIDQMYPVIINKGPGCFKENVGPVCGNTVVEYGEECDCGSPTICNHFDRCCTPNVNTSGDIPCTLRRSYGYQCSPKTVECCTDSCRYYRVHEDHQCRSETECHERAICQPDSGMCPPSLPKTDNSTCDNGRKLCTAGLCTVSVCTIYNLLPCYCSQDMDDACLVCCAPANSTSQQCLPLSHYSSRSDMILAKGDPCFNYQGYCSEDGRCLLLDENADDILKRLFSDETVTDMNLWLRKYWYFIILGILLATLLSILTIFIFKPKPDDSTDAERVGKLAAVVAQAEMLKRFYSEKMEKCETAFVNISEQLRSQSNTPMALTQAVARLSIFFPTAPISLITKCAQASSSEDFAVKMLLIRNFPMQKFKISKQEQMKASAQVSPESPRSPSGETLIV